MMMRICLVRTWKTRTEGIVEMVMETMVTEVWTMEVGPMLLQITIWVALGLQTTTRLVVPIGLG
jgi:hypothetical protein